MHTDLVYDVGMNNGDDTAYYLHRGYRVVAVEANPKLVEQAKQRFSRAVVAERLIILDVAIAAEEGILPFWICSTRSEWSSFSQAIASRNGSVHYQVDVKTCRFASILEKYGVPYYLKIDIEGNDYLCVEDLTASDLPKYLSIEKSNRSYEILPKLNALSYRGYKCINQNHFLPLQRDPLPEQLKYEHLFGWWQALPWGNKFFRRVIAKLNDTRRLGSWQFPYGSSGSFGEDTLGRWQTFDEFMETLNFFQKQCEIGQHSIFWDNARDFSFWADFHVCRGD